MTASRKLGDEVCPECHGEADIFFVWHDRIVKRCRDCKHKWLEEVVKPPIEFVGRGGWVRFNVKERLS